MADVDTVVVGAGAVGLATAAALARAGDDVVVLEATRFIGSGISSRNSEVVHAGLYYPTDSLKHRMCVAGRRLLYPFLEARGVGYRKCGKLVVATDDAEVAGLTRIAARAEANGVESLRLLSAAEVQAREPQLRAVAALWSPETGILNSHGLMDALRSDLEDHGGAIAFNAPLVRAEALVGGGFRVEVGGAEPTSLTCRTLVNSAGLSAPRVASTVDGTPPETIPRTWFAKGSYFACRVRPPFTHLIYPVPVDGGLGVHLTLDLAGRARFGPDVEWLSTDDPDAVDLDVDPERGRGFIAAVRRYWPDLAEDALVPDYAGVRPKISGPGTPPADFRVDGADVHGVEGLVHLFGIESPGLTSALALANHVCVTLGRRPPDWV